MRRARRDNAMRGHGEVFKTRSFQSFHITPPIVTGQCARALELIRVHQPLLSLTATADHAIPEFAARVHDLRVMGFDVITRIEPEVLFRGLVRRRVAFYSLGSPEWPRPGFLPGKEVQHG